MPGAQRWQPAGTAGASCSGIMHDPNAKTIGPPVPSFGFEYAFTHSTAAGSRRYLPEAGRESSSGILSAPPVRLTPADA